MFSTDQVLRALGFGLRDIRDSSAYRIVVPILVGIWCMYVFFSYLPPLSHFPHTIDFYLRRSGAYDILLVLWFTAVAYCAGNSILRVLGVDGISRAERVSFSIVLGIMLFSWLAMGLSLIHGLYRPVAYVLLLIPTLIWHREIRQLPANLCRTLASNIKGASWSANTFGRSFIVLYITASFIVILLSALAPSIEYDDLTYHLVGPKNYILHHGLISLPDIPHLFFPKNMEMLYTLGLLWHCDITAKLIHFLLGILTMVAVYGFSNRFFERSPGMIAVAILASSPLFIWEMKTAHVDLGLTLYIFTAVYAALLWLRTREKSWFRFTCLCLAFSLGVKYWALLPLGVIVLIVFVVLLLELRAVLPSLRSAVRLGFYSSLGLVPWGLVSLYYTGNPLFPLLNGVFHSPYWTSAHTHMATLEMFAGGIRAGLSNWWDLLRLPWAMLTDMQGRFKGNIGPWYVMFLPLLLFLPRRSPALGFLGAFSALYYAAWAVFDPLPRFLLPALPGLAIAAAFAITGMFQLLQTFRRLLTTIAAVFLAVLAIFASPFFEDYGSWSRYGESPISTISFKYLSGRESKSEYLSRSYPAYQAIQYLNRLPGTKKVFFVNTVPDGFYLNGTAAYIYSPYGPSLFGKDADYIHDVLRRNGVTHVVVSQMDNDTSQLGSQESDFTHNYLRKLYERNGCIVYELLALSTEQGAG
jgi:hypothetical protein